MQLPRRPEVKLAELAAAGPTDTHAPRARHVAPKGWEAGVKYDAESWIVTTEPVPEQLTDHGEWAAAVVAMLGQAIPAGWRVRLAEVKHDPAAWHRDAHGEDAVTRAVWRHRFVVEPDPTERSGGDLAELGTYVKRSRAGRKPRPTGELAFMVCAGDMQIGKPDGDGTDGTVRRFVDLSEQAAMRLRELRKLGREIGTIYLPWLGDCIEGDVSQGGTLARRLQLDVTEQVRVYRRLMLLQIGIFAPLAERVVVPVVPGNHDEASRVGNVMATHYADSWAIDGAAAVQDALALNARAYGHVSHVFPSRDELTVTLDVAGVCTTFAHGHQWRAGKAGEWWAGQAHGMTPAGDSTLLVSAHSHHWRSEQTGRKLHVQIPALDGGSTWYRHRTGEDAPPGMVTLALGAEHGALRDLALL